MHYQPDEFIELSNRVDGEGGYALSGDCVGEEFRLKIPDYKDEPKWKRLHTTGCGKSARFAVAYDPTQPIVLDLPVYDAKGQETGEVVKIRHEGERFDGPARAAVCAVDDDLGRWPRYR